MNVRFPTATAAALLVLVTAVVFAPAVTFPFLGLDDPRFVTGNEHIRRGISVENVGHAFVNDEFGYYSPVTYLSHMLDCQLFGMDARGHHVTNVVLHAAGAVLLLLALRRMTGALLPSALVAAVFAVHPLHVEPVAWIAERKGVLSGFFWCATLLAYARYAERPSGVRYGFVFGWATLSMLAKPMAVTIPFTLLLLDLWPLRRTEPRARLVLEKAPLLVPAAVVGWLTVRFQAGIGAVGTEETFPLGERVANALHAYGWYLSKAVAPVHLAALYPFRHGAVPATFWLFGVVGLVVGTAAAAVAFKKRPYATVGWLWFAGTLVPAIGLIHVGSQAMADRYMYVPLIGLALIVVFGAAELLAGAPPETRRVAAVVSVGIVVVFAAMSGAQVLTWKDDEAVYRQIIRVAPDSILAYFNLGNTYLDARQDPATAKDLYEKALAIDPRHGDIQFRLGDALVRMGRWDEANEHLREAVRLRPDLAEAHLALASVAAQQRTFDLAQDEFEAYLALRPNDWRARVGLGRVEGERGDWLGAASALEKATAVAPKDAGSWGLLGFARMQLHDSAAAAAAFRQAIALDPGLPQPRYYLAIMARDAGDRETARREIEALRAIDPALAASASTDPATRK